MFRIEIKGLEELKLALEELSAALKELDGPIAQLRFDPRNEESISNAIREMESAVDAKTARYASNKYVRAIVSETKQKFAAEIRERARSALHEEPGQASQPPTG